MGNKTGILYKFINQYEKLFFFLLFCVAIILLLVSALLQGKSDITTLIATITENLGLAIITSVIVINFYERFLKVKISFNDFKERIKILLANRFSSEIAEGLANTLDTYLLTEKSRDVEIQLNDYVKIKDMLLATIKTTIEVENYCNKPQKYSCSFRSHNLDVESNSDKLLRDGVYEVEDISIEVGSKIIIDTTDCPAEDKRSTIQTVNERKDQSHNIFYNFNKQIVIPAKSTAKLIVKSKRYVPKYNGVFMFFSAIPANMIRVSISYLDRNFIDNLSYSFNVKKWDDNCKTSNIEKQANDTYRRSFSVTKGLFAYQGIKIRWSK